MKTLSGVQTYIHGDLLRGSYGLIVRVPVYGQEYAHQQQELWSQESSIRVTEPTP
jgi:hypothetical protein